MLGIVASLALSLSLASLMFGVEKLDPITLFASPATLMVAALLGCYLPARRAAKVRSNAIICPMLSANPDRHANA